MSKSWTYNEAFRRMRGLVTENEAEKLRIPRIGIVGAGGVGGIHLMTLARMGFERFIISDPDTFEVANFNRQYGADLNTLGRNKAEVMAEKIRTINPNADVEIFPEVSAQNAGKFVASTDLLIDGIDAFEIKLRRRLFQLAHEKGIYSMSFGPFGFSTGWIIFDPEGMSPNKYFRFSDEQSDLENFAAFLVGMCPRGTHTKYLDFAYVDMQARTGPSMASACDLAAGVMGAETLKVILKRGITYAAPWYHQFDPYLNVYHRRYMWLGNANPLQVFKRSRVRALLSAGGFRA